MIVVIDDERTFQNVWATELVHLRTSQEAMLFFAEWVTATNFLPSGATADITDIYFDHDLGSKSKYDGIIVARQVALIRKYDPSCILDDCTFWCHSQNPVGARNIQQVFESLDISCILTAQLPRLETPKPLKF